MVDWALAGKDTMGTDRSQYTGCCCCQVWPAGTTKGQHHNNHNHHSNAEQSRANCQPVSHTHTLTHTCRLQVTRILLLFTFGWNNLYWPSHLCSTIHPPSITHRTRTHTRTHTHHHFALHMHTTSKCLHTLIYLHVIYVTEWPLSGIPYDARHTIWQYSHHTHTAC